MNNSISKLKKIRNKHIQDFLEEHGVYPVYEDYDDYYYESTLQFVWLLDKYHIEFHCIPNKL